MDARTALRFSSRSCKATLVAWTGMCNLFIREERTLLGHHVETQSRSSTTYSRDSQVMLQYKVSKMIGLIRGGKLKPDASRAERLAMMRGEDSVGDDAVLATDKPIDYASSDDDSDDVASPCADSGAQCPRSLRSSMHSLELLIFRLTKATLAWRVEEPCNKSACH